MTVFFGKVYLMNILTPKLLRYELKFAKKHPIENSNRVFDHRIKSLPIPSYASQQSRISQDNLFLSHVLQLQQLQVRFDEAFVREFALDKFDFTLPFL